MRVFGGSGMIEIMLIVVYRGGSYPTIVGATPGLLDSLVSLIEVRGDSVR